MNIEILEITNKFHDTYEKLASEYTYETREDTKVFDINSNNGKLMYATVNEIVSPILKENKELKKQLEEYKATNEVLSHELTKDKVLQQDCLITCCGIPIGDIPKLITQQKEFINFLEDNYKETQDIWYIKILQKYKSIIGVDKNEK